MLTRDAVINEALQLPPCDRAIVADALEESLSGGEFATPELSAAWSAEIDRRLAAYDRGDVTGVGFDQAVNHMRRALNSQGVREDKNRSRKVSASDGWLGANCSSRFLSRYAHSRPALPQAGGVGYDRLSN